MASCKYAPEGVSLTCPTGKEYLEQCVTPIVTEVSADAADRLGGQGFTTNIDESSSIHWCDGLFTSTQETCANVLVCPQVSDTCSEQILQLSGVTIGKGKQ